MSVRGCSLEPVVTRSEHLISLRQSLLSRDWTKMSSSIGKRAIVTSTVIAAFVGTGLVAAPEASATTTIGSRTLSVAKNQIGDPYVKGATGSNKFDCSGLIYYSRFKDTNRNHHKWFNTAQTQYNHTTHISRSSRKAGDLIFFGTSKSNIYHVGILKSANYMIAAPYPGRDVRSEYIGSGSWWANHAHIYYGRMN
jgi:cell wall-associated NlpC family hydrolase